MELTIALALSILNAVMCVLNFAFGRKDKAVKDTKEEKDIEIEDVKKKVLIEYRLGQVETKLDKIIDILDGYEKEIDKRVEKAIDQHIKEYHREG